MILFQNNRGLNSGGMAINNLLNGLWLDGTDGKLGGSLIENTVISLDGFDLLFSGSNGVSLLLEDSTGNFNLNANDFVLSANDVFINSANDLDFVASGDLFISSANMNVASDLFSFSSVGAGSSDRPIYFETVNALDSGYSFYLQGNGTFNYVRKNPNQALFTINTNGAMRQGSAAFWKIGSFANNGKTQKLTNDWVEIDIAGVGVRRLAICEDV